LAHLLTVVIIAIIVVAGTLVIHGVFAVVFSILLDRFKVGIEVGVHVDDVVAIPLLAAVGTLGRAGVGGAEAEADEGQVGHADVVFAVGILVPLGEVVTSLEFEGVVGDPGVVDFTILSLEDTIDAAGAGEDLLSEGGVGGDVGGGGEADDG